MNIHFLDTVQDAQKVQQGTATAYDSIWVNAAVPTQPSSVLEQAMLAQDKLYVVLAIVLIIWIGILFLLYRTDRKILNLERSIEEGISQDYEDL